MITVRPIDQARRAWDNWPRLSLKRKLQLSDVWKHCQGLAASGGL